MTPISTSLKSFSVLATFIASVFLLWASWYMGAYKVMYTLTWDVVGYYMYLPSFFYDWFSNPQHVDYIMQTYHPMPEWYGTIKLGNGNQVFRYSMGQAILYSPAFLVAHFWAKLGGYAVDGFSYPYQFCINWWSTIYAVLGFWILRLSLIRYFSELTVGVTIIILVFATNIIPYATWSAPMTHCYLFTHYAILILLTLKFNEQPSVKRALLIGFVCGIIMLTRFTDGICLLIPLVWGVKLNTNFLSEVLRRLKNRNYYIMLLVFIAVTSLQFFYWKKITSDWYFHVYWGEYLDFKNIHFYKGLFSYERGWLVYTPVMWLAIAGLVFQWFRGYDFALVTTLFFLINIVLVLSWSNWNYGGGYGHRAMVQSYAMLSFPMALMLQQLFAFNFSKYLTIAVISILSWVNCGMCLGHFMPASGVTKEYFWHVWGKWKEEPEAKKLLEEN